MRYLKYLALLGVMLFAAGTAYAQFAVGVGVGPVYGAIGPAPSCAYGYYPYYPYACAPYGYYGPQYFVGGVFIGAGPWFHGWYGGRGWYGRSGYGYWGRGYGYRGWGNRPGYGYRGGARGYVGGGYHGNGGFHGGGGFHASSNFHGGGEFHGGGGFHGGGRR